MPPPTLWRLLMWVSMGNLSARADKDPAQKTGLFHGQAENTAWTRGHLLENERGFQQQACLGIVRTAQKLKNLPQKGARSVRQVYPH